MNVLLGIVKKLACVVYLAVIAALLIGAPMLAGYRPVMVISGSMEPQYPVGSITYYHPTDFESIVVGDVITFDLGSTSLATHRVAAVDENGRTFTTKGDANATQDANPIDYDRVQGETVGFAIPYGGYFITAIRSIYVIVPCAAILLADLLLTPKEKSKAKTAEPV